VAKQRGMAATGFLLGFACLLALLFLPRAGLCETSSPTPARLTIPRVSRPPTLEEFLSMAPPADLAGELLKVQGFRQRHPKDGAPASQSTEVYLGYDKKNLYAVFVCFDQEPEKIRARMVTRENIFGDDTIELMLDTFQDQRRAYAFLTNPFGIQHDSVWTEAAQAFDSSFDTVWHSRGKLTDRGYVVWMAIPFQSLRFSSASACNNDHRQALLDHHSRRIPRHDLSRDGELRGVQVA